MSSADPRVLIPLLEDTQQGLTRATTDCRSAIDRAVATQRQLGEHVIRFNQRVGTLMEQVERDSHLDDVAMRAVETAQSRVDDAQSRSSHINGFARQVLTRSERTREHWAHQVARAKARLRAAEVAVTKATAAVEAATAAVAHATERVNSALNAVTAAEQRVAECERRLAAAHAALANAQAALAMCESSVEYRTDSQGHTYAVRRDCSGYRAAVSAAAQQVRAAESACREALTALTHARRRLADAELELDRARKNLADAQEELARARAELADAREDLRQCQVALAKAEEAVRLATAGFEHAGYAVASAAEARQAAGTARTAMEQVLAWNHHQKQLVENLTLLVRQAEANLDGGATEARLADSHGLRAADLARGGDMDLAQRIEKLRDLERSYNFL